MGQLPVSPAEGKMGVLCQMQWKCWEWWWEICKGRPATGKQEISSGTSSDVFQQLALARDSIKTLQASQWSLRVEGVEDGCAILERERKALRDNSFETPLELRMNLSTLWLCNLSLWFPSTLPENAKPLDGSSLTPFNVAPKPTHWVIALHHAWSLMALWTGWVGWRWSQAAGAAPCPDRILQALPQDLLITPLRSRQGLFRIIQSQSHKGWKRPPRSWSTTFDQNPPCQLNHSSKCHIQLVFWTFLRMMTPPLPWAACSDAWPPFQWRSSFWCPAWASPGAAWGHLLILSLISWGQSLIPTWLHPPIRELEGG